MALRYRAQDNSGDMRFGHGSADFLVDSPAAVAQAVKTRFGLWRGQWFLDLSVGTPWYQSILGRHRRNMYDSAIRSVILGTPYVVRLFNYSSALIPATRQLVVSCRVLSAFGPFAITDYPVPGGPFALGSTPLTPPDQPLIPHGL